MAEIQIAPLGTWKGYVRDNADKPDSVIITPELVRSCITYYEGRKSLIPIDYEHQTLTTYENGKPAPAAGWITALYEGEDGCLMGSVEWTEAASAAIKAREYRYLSPVLVYNGFDPTTGNRVPCYLHSAALTNTPFLDGIREVEASLVPDNCVICSSVALFTSKEGSQMTPDEFIQKLIELLGLAPEAASDPGAILAAIEELAKGASPEAPTETPTETEETKQPVAAKAGTSGVVAVLASRVAKLESTLANRDAVELLREFSDRVTPANRDVLLRIATANPAEARAILSAMPKIVPDPVPGNKPSTDSVALTDEERRVAASMGLNEADVLAAKKEAAHV